MHRMGFGSRAGSSLLSCCPSVCHHYEDGFTARFCQCPCNESNFPRVWLYLQSLWIGPQRACISEGRIRIQSHCFAPICFLYKADDFKQSSIHSWHVLHWFCSNKIWVRAKDVRCKSGIIAMKIPAGFGECRTCSCLRTEWETHWPRLIQTRIFDRSSLKDDRVPLWGCRDGDPVWK